MAKRTSSAIKGSLDTGGTTATYTEKVTAIEHKSSDKPKAIESGAMMVVVQTFNESGESSFV
jgi:hypothetical protein